MSSADAPYRLQANSVTNELFREAERQLNICNSCRFCEGYCAVYPALERRTELTDGDITYLANLCHDCRACLYACMYAPPHEFGVNPPEILAKVRRSTYESLSPSNRFRVLRTQAGTFSPWATLVIAAAVIGIVLGLVAGDHGLGALYQHVTPAGSPYAVVAFVGIVTVSFAFVLFGLITFGFGVVAYWRNANGSLVGLFNVRAWSIALREGATMQYLRGGAEGCYIKESHPSSERRILHYLVSYGFVLCFFSTISAAIEQDLMGRTTPFTIVSVPVIFGIVGGAGLVLGSIGLLRLKSTQDVVATDGPMNAMDRAFLVALLLLGVTGLATLIVRSTPAFGVVLAIHLGIVWSCFVLAPMSKFVHFIYRMLALVQNSIEVAHDH